MPVKSRKLTEEIKSSISKSKTVTGRSVNKNPASKKRTKTITANVDEIRQRAYYKYLARGCVNGHHEEDWYNAEKDIKVGS
ncbi:MAG: DUF2934 domain-containing protein [Elusimicrobiota bacterium]